MISRRQFVGAVAGVILAAPVIAHQPKVPRVGVLLVSYPERTQARFREALRDLGYVEGQNIFVEYRAAPAGQTDQLGGLATDLVRLKVDVIVAQFTPAAHAAKRATAAIPIVMAPAPAGDPLGTGLIASLARPGGNVTGIASIPGPEFSGKLVHLARPSRARLDTVLALAALTPSFGGPESESTETRQ